MCLCIVTSCPPIKSFVFSFLAEHLYRLHYFSLKGDELTHAQGSWNISAYSSGLSATLVISQLMNELQWVLGSKLG